MDMTEELLSSMVMKIRGSYVLTYHPHGSDSLPIEIDFTPPWPRVSMVECVEKLSGNMLGRDFSSPETVQKLESLVAKLEIDCLAPRTAARLLDKLCGHFLEAVRFGLVGAHSDSFMFLNLSSISCLERSRRIMWFCFLARSKKLGSH